MTLPDFVHQHTDRGECHCGLCLDVGTTPDPTHPHTVDMMFFKVAPTWDDDDREAVRASFLALTATHRGDFVTCDPLDGQEHGFQELGAWLGDQGLAMQYMAMGVMLGVFSLLTPNTALPFLDAEVKLRLAQRGLVCVQARQ